MTRRRRADHRPGGVLLKTLVAVWVAFLVVGFVAQTTELYGSLIAVLAWLVLGVVGAVLLIGFGGPRAVEWLEARDRENQSHGP